MIALASGVVGGCENVYRTNHFHSDVNQKAAEQSLDAFEGFTSQTAGLEPSLLKNVDARRQVEDAVATSRNRVRDTEAAGLTTNATWERLRLETYVKLGLLQRDKDENGNPLAPPRPLNLDDDKDFKYAVDKTTAQDYDNLLRRRIATREMKVTAIAKVLKLIGDAHKVITEETDKKYQATQAALNKLKTTTQPATQPTDPTGNARIQWVRELFQTIIDARKAYLDNPVFLSATNEVQRRVLADIENSRDPVEAAALVAVVGTGLSDFDFVILDAYVLELDHQLGLLDERIKNIANEIDPLNPADPSKPAAKSQSQLAWEALRQSLCEARAWVKVAVWLTTAETDPNAKFVGPGPRTRWADHIEAQRHDQVFQSKLKSRYSASKEFKATRPGIQPDDPVAQAKAALQELLDECDKDKAHLHPDQSQPQPKADAKALRANFSAQRLNRFDAHAESLKLSAPENELLLRVQVLGNGRDGSALQDTVDAIRRSRQSVKDAASRTQVSAAAVTTSAAELNAQAAQDKSAGLTSPRAQAIAGLAKVAGNRADTAVKLRSLNITTSDTANLAKQLGDSGLKDLNAEKGFQLLNNFLGLDAQVAGFIDDAVKSKAISEDELKFLGGIVNDIEAEQAAKHERILIFLNDLYGAAVDLGQENSRHAQGMLTVANIEFRRWVLLGLLNDNYQEVYVGSTIPGSSRLFQTEQEIKDVIAAHKPTGAATGNPDLRLHPFIEKSSRIWPSIRELTETTNAFHKAPQVNDPDGFNIVTANDRVFKAVRTVDGHLLMISLNQHISEDNVVRLHFELASHDIRLDTLKTRVEEAGYRLALGDLKAFHSSGITDQDIQTVSDVFANGFLAWIGSGTNSGSKK